ncbi:MAG: hypothetical protein DRO89_00140 [Candidatus Altiarchaeales archaeon]|nr:MAG: hypothetical protein DRO89_00140 [Candidatus Altiarchaeales archaeon]
MIIKSIKLQNFRSHSNTELNFDTGISVLIGENGAGKTSILEAISFALFKQHVAKIDDLIKRETHEMGVELVFEHNGKEYKVIRKKRENTGPESRLFIKNNGTFLGNMIQEGDRAVTEEIRRILQTDETLFLNAIYIRQGEIARLLDASPSERKNIVGRLLGIDALQKAWSNMHGVIGDFESKRIEIEAELKGRKDIETELQNNKKELEMKKGDEIKKREEISLQEERVEELKKRKEEYDKRRERYLKLSSDMDNQKRALREKTDRKSRLLSRLKEIDEAELETRELKPMIEQIPFMERLQQLKNDEKIILQRIKEIEKELKQIAEYERISRETRKNYKEYCQIKDKIEEIRRGREKYAGADGELKQVEDCISRSREKIKKLEGEISRALREASSTLDCGIDSIEQLKEILVQKKTNLEKILKETDSRYTELKDRISGLKAMNRELKKAITELDRAKGKCPTCGAPLTEEHKAELLREYNTRRASNDHKIRELESRAKDLELKKKELSNMKESIDKIPIDLLESRSGTIREEKDEIKRRAIERDRLLGKVKKLTEIDSTLSEKDKLMKELEPDYKKYESAQHFLGRDGKNKPELEASLASETERLMETRRSYQSYASKLKTVPEDITKELDMLRRSEARYNELLGVIKGRESLKSELTEVRSRISEHRKRINELSREIDTLEYNKEEHEKIIKSLETCREKLNALRTERENLRVEIKRITEDIEKLEQKLERLTLRERELKKIENFISFLSRLRELFGKDGLQKELRIRARPAIEEFTKEIFGGFDMRYSNITIDDDYNIEMYGMDGSKSIDMISGGEKIAIALALRLGIARVLSKGRSELMILDEPTIHLDSYRRQELVQIFRKLKMLPQVILVTHDPELEGAADHLFKIEWRNGRSICTAA